MQKLLNTYLFVPCSHLWQRIFLTTKTTTTAIIALLLLIGMVQPAAATDFYKDFVIIASSNNNNNSTYYPTNNQFGTKFQGTNLGSFDRSSGRLLIGGEANTESTDGDNIYTPQMYYRVYLQNTPQVTINSIPFTPLTLNFQSSGEDNNPEKRKWSNTTANSNILAATEGPGAGKSNSYILEVYFSAFVTYDNKGGRGNFYIYDSQQGANYKATFEVTGEEPLTWNGTQGTDWFDQRNWSPNGLPNANTDVTVGFNTNTANTNYPTISGLSPADATGQRYPAAVRTLNIEGKPATKPDGTPTTETGGNVFLVDGELQIYGSFRDPNAGFNQTGGTLTFAGATQTINGNRFNQAIDGGRFTTVHLQGGNKSLSGQMSIINELRFMDDNSAIETPTSNPPMLNVNLELGAQIIGETEKSYVSGILIGRSQDMTSSSPGTFGNIGVEVKPASNYSGLLVATRRTGTSYTGTGPKNTSITRSFSFSQNISSAFDLTFKYRTAELNSLTPSNFVVYRSVNGALPFENLGSTSSTDNVVILQGATGALAATFTLGEGINPLPVTLVSFTATPTPQGTALLRWTTASETNNKGFGIERQLASGATWQSVGYLASGNNATGGTYEYTDKSLASAMASPQAYYRLRQEDQDGKLSYSPVAVIARPTLVASTALVLSPVPATGASISLTFAEVSQAGAEISIINTQGQRLLSYTTEASDSASLSLPIERLAAGVYIVSVRVPGQALRHARFVKL